MGDWMTTWWSGIDGTFTCWYGVGVSVVVVGGGDGDNEPSIIDRPSIISVWAL